MVERRDHDKSTTAALYFRDFDCSVRPGLSLEIRARFEPCHPHPGGFSSIRTPLPIPRHPPNQKHRSATCEHCAGTSGYCVVYSQERAGKRNDNSQEPRLKTEGKRKSEKKTGAWGEQKKNMKKTVQHHPPVMRVTPNPTEIWP